MGKEMDIPGMLCHEKQVQFQGLVCHLSNIAQAGELLIDAVTFPSNGGV